CIYDPSVCSYDALLDTFFSRVDPTTLNRQGNDSGTQYRSAIYFHSDEQRKAAAARVAALDQAIRSGSAPPRWAGERLVVQLEPAGDYFLAEDYHQQYLERGGRLGSGQSAAKGCTDRIRCYG
ncbi:Peptide methionine sulfoxide reductase A4, chloroplastic, partial [Tetrabaena socialis]